VKTAVLDSLILKEGPCSEGASWAVCGSVSTTKVSTKERAAMVEWMLKGKIRKNQIDKVYITSLVQTHHN
jgi:hypothetical protein